jgi:hypothetical protein
MLIKWTQQAHIRRKYPVLKLLYHIPNERQCSPVQGRLLKLLGVKSGVPDLHLPASRGGYHGLYIEMKADKGKVSENQSWWIEELEAQGYKCAVCRGYEEAIKVLEDYLCGRVK